MLNGVSGRISDTPQRISVQSSKQKPVNPALSAVDGSATPNHALRNSPTHVEISRLTRGGCQTEERLTRKKTLGFLLVSRAGGRQLRGQSARLTSFLCGSHINLERPGGAGLLVEEDEGFDDTLDADQAIFANHLRAAVSTKRSKRSPRRSIAAVRRSSTSRMASRWM